MGKIEMSSLDGLCAIIKNGDEEEAMIYLVRHLAKQREKSENKEREYRARIRAIRKINANSKDHEAIDALCDLDN